MKINKAKYRFSLLATLIFLFFSCNENIKKENTNNTEKVIVKIDSVEITDSVIKLELDQFRIEKLNEYGYSVNSYFQTFGWGKSDYEFKSNIDTVINEDNICYSYKVGIPFNIYEFETKKGATDYFNELMTIELVSKYGINKRPNHILVDSNKVYWLKMEHSYGHRMKDIKAIFQKAFEFYPNSTNLDSISGFNYCRQCNSADTTLNEIIGDWYASDFIEIDTIDYSNNASYNGIIKFDIDTIVLSISKNFIHINKIKYRYNISWARRLPDARFYWEYRFVSPMFGKNSNRLTPEFSEKMEQLKKYREEIYDYKVKVINRVGYPGFIIARTNNSEIYLRLGNRFYILHK